MLRRWVRGVVVVAVVFGSLGWSATAMAKEEEPSDYYLVEFALGEVGLVVGGSIGNLIGEGVCSFELWQVSALRGLLFCGVGGFSIVTIVGGAVGTGLLVVLAGQAYNVAGNVLDAYLGAFIGTAAGLVMLVPAFVALPLALVALATPSVFSVIGYNIDAKMKDTGKPASLPWTLDLPVLSLEF